MRDSAFPDPRTLSPDDSPVLAYGAVWQPEVIVDAYRHGIFPWPDGDDVWWWSPDPRMVFMPGDMHISRSLRRTLTRDRFTISTDQAFSQVVAGCADRSEGTWITAPMRAAYEHLHELGIAHSIEVWDGRQLAGGLYGVQTGGAFTGESMFHRVTDASKVALVRLSELLAGAGFTLLDAQLPTDHLRSMGGVQLPRDTFLDLLADAVERDRAFPVVPRSG